MSRGRKPGRPPQGEQPKTEAERAANYQQRKKAEGLVRVSVLVPQADAEAVRQYAERLRRDRI